MLIDERLEPPALYFKTEAYSGQGTFGFVSNQKMALLPLERSQFARANAWEKKDWNLRIQVARAPWGGAVAGGIHGRAATWGGPTTADAADARNNAVVLKLEDIVSLLRQQHGLLKTDVEAAAFKAELKRLGEQAMLALMEAEGERERKSGEPFQAQTDYIGLDVMVVVRDGKLVPKVIEVNDHDSGGQPHYDWFYPEKKGGSSKVWVANALARAGRDAIKGKHIVVVGAGYPNKRPFLERARQLGIEVILVDKGLSGLAKLWDRLRVLFGRPSRDNWARGLVSEFVNVDLSRAHEVAEAEAVKRLKRLGKLDGITTYWEDDVFETARIAERLGLRYHPVSAVAMARSKHLTRRGLANAGLKTPFSRIIASRADLIAALNDPAFPAKAILKPEQGAEAQFSEEVDRSSVLEVYDRLSVEMAGSDDAVFKHSRRFMLDTYLEGPEWDANVVVQDGRVLSATLTDNWDTLPGNKKATGSSLPSRAMQPEQQRAALDVAAQAVLKLGFADGIFHVEGKGKDLIEINARPGGSYTLEWDKAGYGVDEVEMLFMTAAGVPAVSLAASRPLKYLEGAFVFSAKTGVVKTIGLTAEAAKIPGLSVLIEKKPGKTITAVDNRVAFISAEGRSAQEALAKLGADPSRLLRIEFK